MENKKGPGPESEAIPETTNGHHTANVVEYMRGLKRRRAATWRLPPLPCGHADPWTCAHRDDPSDVQVDGYAAAVEHLNRLGLTAAPFLPELRRMWNRGDRRLAVTVTERWETAS